MIDLICIAWAVYVIVWILFAKEKEENGKQKRGKSK